jgi:undecaprenyl-diphosphatase
MENALNFFVSLSDKFSWLGNWLFLFIAFTECIPFFGAVFPGGTLVSVGGFLAAQGYFSVWEIILFAVIGAIIGDYLGYSLGRWGGAWMIKKGLFKEEWMTRGEAFFKKHGAKSIFWGRFVGATRAFVPFIAGAGRMPQGKFFFWNASGAIFWAAYSALIGYFYGSIFGVIVRKWSHRLGYVLMAVVIIAALYWLIKKRGQSIWQYFKKWSQAFTDWLLERSWFRRFDSRYPITEEFFVSPVSQERIFGSLLWTIVLIMLYILVVIMDFI